MNELIKYSTIPLSDSKYSSSTNVLMNNYEENIRFKRQTGSDVVIIISIKISATKKNEIEIYCSQDWSTKEYAPLVDDSIKTVVKTFESQGRKIMGFKVEIYDGKVHDVDFNPSKIRFYFKDWFTNPTRKRKYRK